MQAAFEAIGPFDHLVITAGPALRSWGSFMDPDMRGDRSYLEGKFLGNWACARNPAPHFRNLGWDWKGERKGPVGTVKNLNPRNSPKGCSGLVLASSAPLRLMRAQTSPYPGLVGLLVYEAATVFDEELPPSLRRHLSKRATPCFRWRGHQYEYTDVLCYRPPR